MNTNSDFETYVKKELSAYDFERLDEALQTGKRTITSILKDPRKATTDQMLELAALLRVSPATLIQKYNVGYNNITLEEADRYCLLQSKP